MAAKPPKPPGNFLKLLLHQNKYQNNNEKTETEDNSEHLNNTSTKDNSSTTEAPAAAKQPNCNCSNISIMHLFHEMKQEFPTIPDTIVAQCVNENCHQRENCIQMLRNELELNPIPAQSYPAKVLHPPAAATSNNNTSNAINNNNNATTTPINTPTTLQKPPLQQKPQIVQQKPPLKPLKPIRAAPLQPPPSQQTPTPTTQHRNSPLRTSTTTPNKNILHASGAGGGGVEYSVSSGGVELNDMPTKNLPQYKQSTPQSLAVNSLNEVNNNENNVVCSGGVGGGESSLQRQRPTTLNLNTPNQKQQQQQRQRLNIQLQRHFEEQRNKQQQQQSQITTKPIRKAPLPPIAPKPLQFQLTNTNNNQNNTSNYNNNSFNNDTLSSTHTSPLSESEISVSVSLSTPSPTSSSSLSALSSSANKTQHFQPAKSPIRHRSVITLQPEPPYTRDFASAATTANSSSATSSPTTSLAGSQKSFTSVNLTLRPPVVVTPTGSGGNTTALQQQPSTIDITAGPGFTGASGGAGGKSLHYSSTSYDARLGYQQNFQITVTDEGSIFSASRIRPQQQQQRSLNQVNISENQYDGNSGCDNSTNNINLQQQQQQQLYLLQQQQQQQFHNNNVVALQQNIQNSINSPLGVGGGGGGGGAGDNMCLPPQQALDGFTAEILQRQKKRRDKLAAALRENKKRLGQEEQEINLITGPIPEGLSLRLDAEIHKLRLDCEAMLRSSKPFTQQSQKQQQQQPQPQPFPRQKPARPPPRPPPPRQCSLDFIQHHSQSSTPHTPPAASLPNLNILNTPSPILAHHHPHHQQLQQQHSNSISPSFYQHQASPSARPNEDIYADTTDEEDYQDEDNEYDEVVEPWECNMCTFRNHPQLNICEACDNVRILPGTLPNLSRAISNSSANAIAAATAAAAVASPAAVDLLATAVPSTAVAGGTVVANNVRTANGNLEHDTNLAQQQLQHFALHT